MTDRTRLILDVPRTAADNMALDEALLDHATGLTLRRTAWAEPAATLGRFQPHQRFVIAGTLRDSVRRITGGGAILHDTDCTVAVVAPVPSVHFPERTPEALMQRAATTLRAALAGQHAELRVREAARSERDQVDIADCFGRSSIHDLVVGKPGSPSKVAGLALYRRGERVLVQGSIRRELIDLSSETDAEFLMHWARELGATEIEQTPPTDAELATMRRYAETRYGRSEWNQRR